MKLISDLRERLEAEADPHAKAWWENYVKQGAPFLGVKMSDIRKTVEEWHMEAIEGELDIDEQVELACDLIREDYAEEKLAGILFLQVILVPSGAVDCIGVIDEFAELFDDGSIHDWNICDWFSVKVLASLIREQGMTCAEAVSSWHIAENLWRARASLVPFVKVADESSYYGLVDEACGSLLAREERFAKTAVGWVLSDISRHDPEFTRSVVLKYFSDFSADSLGNAVKRLDDRDELVARHEELDKKG